MDRFDVDRLELEHLFLTVARLENICFQIKALCITLVCGAIGFIASRPQNLRLILISAVLIVAIFWTLDARYLFIGRQLRSEYATVFARMGGSEGAALAKSPENRTFGHAFFSWSVFWTYAALMLLLLGLVLTFPFGEGP